MSSSRKEVSQESLDLALENVNLKLHRRLKEKGHGGFKSGHEILGVITEELSEYEDAVRYNQGDQQEISELYDIAVGAVHAIASKQERTTDW